MLGTAMLFLAAGSIWAHFGLGPIFLEPPFWLGWILIHGSSFLSLSRPRLQKLLPLSSLAGLQLYFHASFNNFDMPFFPMAPVFFLIATLSLTAYRWGRAGGTLAFCALGWASTAIWMGSLEGFRDQIRAALSLGMGLNLFFIGAFLVTLRFFSKRMRSLVEGLGAKKSFDSQRIHAARLQALGEIAASLAHEIHTPLTSINGYSYQIKGEIEDHPTDLPVDVVRSANERIKFNVDRIIEITKVMRAFARGKPTEEMTTVSVKDVLRDTLALMRHNVRAAGVDLNVELPEKDCFVYGNLVQMSQVLVNLLSNARDACLEADRRKVSVGFESREGRVVLWVEDTGPGISDDMRADVFRAFFTTKPSGSGTGLGLYIASMIAQRHQGQLAFDTLRDPAGRVLGTRFEFSLKLLEAGSGQQAA